ncbi:acyltransferase family protein [Olleya namhaensis]|uniref:acyltransferase family protein n=1 Tax=Olleya namhaensis TaxID=1144750 RepID=UPI002491C93C|nr:acyltransferase [Olleya namhaensis]
MSTIQTQKLNYIDALRGIAILMVIVHHTSQQGSVATPYWFGKLCSLGTRGVQLFFVASAFTLYRSYRNRVLDENKHVKNFFIRRFFRIAPIYYLAILYFIFHKQIGVPYWLGNQPLISSSNIVSNVFFVNGISPYWINSLVPGGWSITVEVMFYTLFPFLFLKIKNINNAFTFLIVTLLIKLVVQEFLIQFQMIPSDHIWREFIYYNLTSQLPVFAIGIIMFFLIENFKNFNLVSKKIKILSIILLLLQVGSKFDFLFVNHIFFAIIFLVFGVILSKGYLGFISNKVILYIGKISFSMYIIHFIVISWLKYFNFIDFTKNAILNYSIRLLLVVVISVVFSTVTYKLIEVKFQELGKKIIVKLQTT